MTAGRLTVRVGDQSYGLQACPSRALSYFRRAYAACLAPSEQATHRYILSRRGRGWQARGDDDAEIASGSLREVTRLLDWELARRAVKQDSACAAFHAAWAARDGQAVMIAGEGGSGKSRLCLQLLEHGFRCGAEDVTFIGGGQLMPFPHAIRLRSDDPVLRTLEPARLFPACDGRICVSIGDSEAAGRTPADRLLIVVLDRTTAPGPRRALAPLDGLQRIFKLCHRLDRVDQAAFATFSALASAGRMFTLPGDSAPSALLELFEAYDD